MMWNLVTQKKIEKILAHKLLVKRGYGENEKTDEKNNELVWQHFWL